MDQRHRVLLIGFGNMGRIHYRSLKENHSFDLVGLVDPALSELPPLGPDAVHAHELADVPEDLYDVAIVAAPTEMHFGLVESLLQQGKHVLVEKPAASSREDAQRLVTLAEEKGCHLAVGHVERCNPALDALVDVLDSGVIGVPVHVAAARCGAYPRSVQPGNQVFLDLAVHELDALMRLFSQIRVVDGFYHCLQQSQIPDLAEVRLRLPHGAEATVHVNWFTPQKMRTIRVTGTAGVAELDYVAQRLTLFAKNLPNLAAIGRPCSPIDHPFCEMVDVEVTKGQPISRQLQEFAKMLAGQPHILCHGADIVASLQLLDECLEKSRTSLSPDALVEWRAKGYKVWDEAH